MKVMALYKKNNTILCSKCQTFKHESLFHKDSGRTNGFDSTCKECRKKYRNKEKYYLKSKRHIDKFPMKQKARLNLKIAIDKGLIVRPGKCSNCNETTKIQAHHEDYNKPLEVKWLCVNCHKNAHKGRFL
jgi:hypothetical protein